MLKMSNQDTTSLAPEDEGCDVRINPEYIKAIFDFAKKPNAQLGEAFAMFLPDVAEYENKVLIRFFIEINEEDFQTSNRWAELWTDEEYNYAKNHDPILDLNGVLDHKLKKKFSEIEKTEFLDPYHIAEALQYYKLSDILKEEIQSLITGEEKKAKEVSAKFDSTSEPWDSDEDVSDDEDDGEIKVDDESDENNIIETVVNSPTKLLSKDEEVTTSSITSSESLSSESLSSESLSSESLSSESLSSESLSSESVNMRKYDDSNIFGSDDEDDNKPEAKFDSRDTPATIVNKTLKNLEDSYREEVSLKKKVTFGDDKSSSSSSSSVSTAKLDFSSILSTLPQIPESQLQSIAEKAKVNKAINPEMLDVILKTLSKSYTKAYQEKLTKKE
jgi:hypothetical protein